MNFKNTYGLIFTTVVLLSGCGESPKGLYDEKAIEAIENLSTTIGDLQSCSLTVYAELTDPGKNDGNPVIKQSDVYLKGNDHMFIYSVRNNARYGYWFDGSFLSTFHFDENVYDQVQAPPTVLETIDSVHRRYEIDFPAADFWYPTLTEDMINQFDTIIDLGSKNVGDILCKEINAFNSNLDVYILIEESTNLPKQLEIYYLGEKKGQTYFSTFSNWRLNPNLDDEIFQFAPPEGSEKAVIFQ
jgi:outer membrane lipoprotein-sorting protein